MKQFEKLATGKMSLIWGIIFISMMVFLRTGFATYAHAGTNGNPMLEMLLIYSPQDIFDLLDAYGPEGRAFYIRTILLFDFIIPLIYSFFFTVCTIWIMKKLSMKSTWKTLAFILGIIQCLSDWIENIFLLIVTANYPNQLKFLVNLASVSTLLKAALTIFFLVIIVIGLTFLLLKNAVRKGR